MWSPIAATVEEMPLTTAVSCQTVRIHPAIVAHAAAARATLLGGRFALGLGTGEALNEHAVGARWSDVSERLEMLTEALDVIGLLDRVGQQSHRPSAERSIRAIADPRRSARGLSVSRCAYEPIVTDR